MKKFYQRKWFIAVCVIIAIGVIGSMMNNDKEDTSDNTTPPNTESTEPTSTIESAPVEETDITEEITAIVKKEFGEENFDFINYATYNDFLMVKTKGKENLTSSMTVKGMYMSMAKVLEELSALSELENINIAFNITYPLKDKYGNASDVIVIKATYNHESRIKIDWDGFSWENIPDVADEWWMHNALENALK